MDARAIDSKFIEEAVASANSLNEIPRGASPPPIASAMLSIAGVSICRLGLCVGIIASCASANAERSSLSLIVCVSQDGLSSLRPAAARISRQRTARCLRSERPPQYLRNQPRAVGGEFVAAPRHMVVGTDQHHVTLVDIPDPGFVDANDLQRHADLPRSRLDRCGIGAVQRDHRKPVAEMVVNG